MVDFSEFNLAKALYESAVPEIQKKYDINSDEMIPCSFEEQPEKEHWFQYAKAAKKFFDFQK